jgi:hypothetical protein
MSNYSPLEVLKKEPVAVAGAIKVVLASLVLGGAITLGSDALASWVIALEAVLSLFYVRAASVSRAALDEVSGE